MSQAVENLKAAFNYAMEIRPKVGGFPYLAEVLRAAGVRKNIWNLPACSSLYLTKDGPVMNQGTPLATGMLDIPKFNQDALIVALRIDQAGNSTFPQFLESAWQAGVVMYEVDFAARKVSYFGCNGEVYVEEYPAVEIKKS